jgi:hypothetical protein
MKLTKISNSTIVFLLIFFFVSEVYSVDYVFFLLDKSGSMLAEEPETGKTVFQLAKERIYKTIRTLPALSGRRKVKLILFDSKLTDSFEIDLNNIREAKEVLDRKKPDGMTTIGDRLMEVHNEILQTGYTDVEIYLFSDLKENVVGKVSLKDAIRTINESLTEGDLKNIDWTLCAYTWINNTAKELKKTLLLPNTKTCKITDDKPRIIFERPDDFFMDVLEKNEKIVNINEGVTRIAGVIDTQLLNNNIELIIKAECPELNGAEVLLDEKNAVRIQKNNLDEDGRFIIETKIKFTNIDKWSYQKDIKFWENTHKIIFTPEVYPDKYRSEDIADQPKQQTAEFKFVSIPQIQVINYPVGKKMFFDNIIEGEPLAEAFEFRWNRGAIGKQLTWTLPANNLAMAYMATASGNEIDDFSLGTTFHKRLMFKINHAQTIKDGEVVFKLQGTSQTIHIPFNLITKKPTIHSVVDKKHLVIPPTKKENIINDIMQLETNSKKGNNSFELKIYGCQGAGCDSLKFSLFDPEKQVISADLDKQTTTFSFEKYKTFGLRVHSDVVGKKSLKLRISSNDMDILMNKQRGKTILTEFTIDVATPEISWQMKTTDGKINLGTNNYPISFTTKGEPFLMSSAGFITKASLNTQSNIVLYYTLQLLPESEDNIVEKVRFEHNNKNHCYVGDFLNNPNLIFCIDSSKKGMFWAVSGRGVIKFQLKSENDIVPAILPEIYYEVKLKP